MFNPIKRVVDGIGVLEDGLYLPAVLEFLLGVHLINIFAPEDNPP